MATELVLTEMENNHRRYLIVYRMASQKTIKICTQRWLPWSHNYGYHCRRTTHRYIPRWVPVATLEKANDGRCLPNDIPNGMLNILTGGLPTDYWKANGYYTYATYRDTLQEPTEWSTSKSTSWPRFFWSSSSRAQEWSQPNSELSTVQLAITEPMPNTDDNWPQDIFSRACRSTAESEEAQARLNLVGITIFIRSRCRSQRKWHRGTCYNWRIWVTTAANDGSGCSHLWPMISGSVLPLWHIPTLNNTEISRLQVWIISV
jgi:hypothetical protein